MKIEEYHYEGNNYDNSNPNDADPYIKVFLDNTEIFRTRTQYQKKSYVHFGETLSLPRMRKTSSIRFEVYDEDGGFLEGSDDLMSTWDTTVDALLKKGCRQYNHPYGVCVKAFWRDEMID